MIRDKYVSLRVNITSTFSYPISSSYYPILQFLMFFYLIHVTSMIHDTVLLNFADREL